jgi:hypothetical protein
MEDSVKGVPELIDRGNGAAGLECEAGNGRMDIGVEEAD